MGNFSFTLDMLKNALTSLHFSSYLQIIIIHINKISLFIQTSHSGDSGGILY